MNLRPAFAGLLAALSLAALSACDDKKSETPAPTTNASTNASSSASASGTPSTNASASASTTTDPVIEGSAAPSTSAAASANASVSANTVKSALSANTIAGTATATGSVTTMASAAPSDSAAAAAACGGKDQPKCPLQAWMSGVMQPAMASKDAAKLSAALKASAKFAPAGYGQWAQFANDGAAAVDASKDVADGKASCKNCHGAYQKKYRTEMRDRKI